MPQNELETGGTAKNDNRTIAPGRTLRGSLPILSSKSDLHRLIFCGCLADAPCTIGYRSSLSKDISATVSCFRTLGAQIAVSDDRISVLSPVDLDKVPKIVGKDTEIFCGESGSTARFLLPLVSAVCKNGAVLTGAGKLPERPFSDLCRCLAAHGAVYTSESMPIGIVKSAAPSGKLMISGNISSQYLSGLLLMLPLFPDCSVQLTTPLSSAGYVEMTCGAMARFGAKVSKSGGCYTCTGFYHAPDRMLFAEGDWSNAAFFLCAAKHGAPVTLTEINPQSTQPDRRILEVLIACGYRVETAEKSVTVERPEEPVPFVFDAGENPDLVPILCVLAATIRGRSIIRNVSRLRYKESDRIRTVCALIDALGGQAFPGKDGENEQITVDGTGSLCGGTVDGCNDHRIVMAAAAASCFCENEVTILGAQAAEKSYPDFFGDFEQLTGGTI